MEQKKSSQNPVSKSVKTMAKKVAKKDEFFIASGKIKVPVSNPQKIYFPREKITKKMVVEYYQLIAKYILPFLKDRPESLKRNPNGILDAGFYHKDAGENAPDFIRSFPVHSESTNKEIDYIICNDKATLAYLNNLGCIELNPWHSTIKKPDHPDYMIIDIDPSDKNNFDQVVEVAKAYKKLFDKAGAKCFCKTSGSTGLHIYVPMKKKYTYEEVKNFAHQLCIAINEMLPDYTTLTRNLAKRGNKKIYLDYLQNRAGQTIASVYSLRPKKGATVSMPLEWKEVKKGLTPDRFNIHNAAKIIEKKPALFNGIFGAATNIPQCIKKLNLPPLGN
jgi:bifunctional non-homologous end joining protein LigD